MENSTYLLENSLKGSLNNKTLVERNNIVYLTLYSIIFALSLAGLYLLFGSFYSRFYF